MGGINSFSELYDVKKQRGRERGFSDLGEIAARQGETFNRLLIDESRLHPSLDISDIALEPYTRWLDLVREGSFRKAVRANWWTHGDVEELLDGAERIGEAIEGLIEGLSGCSQNSTLSTASFSAELSALREVLYRIPFVEPDHRSLFISTALTTILATSTHSPVRRALAFMNVFDAELKNPRTTSLHRVALLRVYEDLAAGSVRTFRHFMESPFRISRALPFRNIREAAFRGVEAAFERLFAKQTKGRLESLAFLVALSGVAMQEVWEAIRPLITQMVKTHPPLASYAVDMFFPVGIKGAPHADEFLREQIKLFFGVSQSLGSRMQRHFTGFFPLDWDSVMRGRVPNLPPAIRGFSATSEVAALKHHLIDHFVPARPSQRIEDGVEIIPSQATALGRLAAELFSIGQGAYITIVNRHSWEAGYESVPHSLVVGTACIDPRSHPGELYLALGKSFHQMPLNGSAVRLTPTPLSSTATIRRSDDGPIETVTFSQVASELYEIRWLARRIVALLRGDDVPHVEDQRIVLSRYEQRAREKLLEAEAQYRSCREQLLLITDYYRGRREGAVQLCNPPAWLGMTAGAIELSLNRGVSTVQVPLPDAIPTTPGELDQLIFDQLKQIDPLLRTMFDETVLFLERTLSPYSPMRSLIDFARSSERRRSGGGAFRLLGACSRFMVTRTVDTVKACIGR
jgi:hypothetical protein